MTELAENTTVTTYKTVRGVRLRAAPARDARFAVVDAPEDLAEFVPGSPAWCRESLHRHYHTEVQSLEIAAQTLADFADAPWPLRLEHARQCWDEARHAALIARRLAAIGGALVNFRSSPSTGASRARSTASSPGWSCRTGRSRRARWTCSGRCAIRGPALGDPATAAVMDGILADEIQHVRFANAWLRDERARNPAVVLQVARAVDFLRRVTAAFTPEQGAANAAGVSIDALDRHFAANVSDRRLAGFDDFELGALTAVAA